MIRFAAPGDVFLRDIQDKTRKVKQILWGDWLNVEEDSGGWLKVKWGADRYWIAAEDTLTERPLEVVFLDVGQGDGCLVVTPDMPPQEKVLLVDAGDADNMYRFVKWRFGKLKKDVTFHAAIITHSDKDHYAGFQKLFEQERFSFSNIYHNGIAERAGDALFGVSDSSGRYLIDLVESKHQMLALYSDEEVRGTPRPKLYPKLMWTALQSGRTGDVAMLSTRHGEQQGGRAWLPGFAPGDDSGEVTIEILGPVCEPDGTGKPRLRWFGGSVGSTARDEGKTKNGHSVILRLRIRDFTLLLGGDLNAPAEDFLLRHYGGIADGAPLATAVAQARQRFSADIMKSCHHGSADVTDEFLDAVSPHAFVISSGDEESHVHPRPDLLGRLGRHGRGKAPLLLCTELLRSTREREDPEILKKITAADKKLAGTGLKKAEREALQIERDGLLKRLAARNVEVYGAITLRTDGRKMVVAFRMEKERVSGKTAKRWQTYWFHHVPGQGFVADGAGSH